MRILENTQTSDFDISGIRAVYVHDAVEFKSTLTMNTFISRLASEPVEHQAVLALCFDGPQLEGISDLIAEALAQHEASLFWVARDLCTNITPEIAQWSGSVGRFISTQNVGDDIEGVSRELLADGIRLGLVDRESEYEATLAAILIFKRLKQQEALYTIWEKAYSAFGPEAFYPACNSAKARAFLGADEIDRLISLLNS